MSRLSNILSKRAVIGWVVYDIGTTLFYVGIIGLFFPLWITRNLGGNDATVGFTTAISMTVMLFIAPIIGTLSDQFTHRKRLLGLTSFVCVGATLLMGGDNLTWALALFVVAFIALQSSSVFYNAMLSDVSTRSNRGTISGLGVGVGYIGAILAVLIGLILVVSADYVLGFRVIGSVFLIVSLPILVFLKENSRPQINSTIKQKLSNLFLRLRSSIHDILNIPGLAKFLLCRFWYMCAVNTSSSFAILYGTDTVGFSEREVEFILLIGILTAIPSSILCGKFVDRVGHEKSLRLILIGWIVLMTAAIAIPLLDLPTQLWLLMGLISGLLVASIWTVDRPYILHFSNSQNVGEFFGIHSSVSRMSAMVGSFSWGFISVTLELGQIAAVVFLTLCVLVAIILSMWPWGKSVSDGV